MNAVHPHIGHFWVRKLKSHNIYLVGYLWLNDERGAKKRVFTCKMKPNICKISSKSPDYIIFDYSTEKFNEQQTRVYDKYSDSLAKEARALAKKQMDKSRGNHQAG